MNIDKMITPLRFWCYKIIPLVYDDSLSYLECLAKMRDKINEVIKNTNEIPDYIDQKIKESFDDEHIRELISEIFRTIEDAITANNEGTNTNFENDYEIGTLLWHDNKLYRAKRHIDAGDTVIVDTNIELVNFADMFDAFITEIKTDFTDNDDGLRETSSMDRPVHDLVWLNNVLYEVIKPIAEGNAYIYSGANKNVEQTNLDKIYDYLLDLISSEIDAREDADDALQNNIDNEATARENADTTLQNNIDAEATARENADTALQGNIDAEATARENAIEAEANTRYQADLHIDERITQMTNDLNSVIATREFNWHNRKFLFCGDSYGEDPGEWPSLLISNYSLSGRAYNLCVGGAGFVSSGSPYLFIEQIQNFVSAHPEELSSITDIVVCGGLNDSFAYEISNYTAVQNAMGDFDSYVKSVMPFAKISLGYIGNGNDRAQGSLISGRIYACRQVCRYIYYNQASRLRWNILHNVEYLLTGSPANIDADGVHPSPFGSYELALGIGEALINGSADYNYPLYDAQPSATIGVLSAGYMQYKIHNNVAEIVAGSLIITVNQGTTLVGGVSTVIMTLNGMYFNNPVNVNVICTTYNATVGGSGPNYVNVKGRLTFIENKVYLAIMEGDGTGYLDTVWNSAGTLNIIDFEKTFDSMILV